MNDDGMGYRNGATPVTTIPKDSPSVHDEADITTIKMVRRDIVSAMDDLDKWHAFDLKEEEGLDIKGQIKAHQLAYEILSNALATIDNTIEQVSTKYRS